MFVNVLVSASDPINVYSSNYSICYNTGGTVSLSGSGGLGTSFGWYIGSCGGTGIGTGSFLITPSPTVTTTYWGRNQTVICGNSNCKSLTITVDNLIPQQPDTITGNSTPQFGATEVYQFTLVPGFTYTWTAPSGWTGTGTLNSVSYIVGSGSGNISVISSNGCGTSQARTLDVTTGFNISGYYSYDNPPYNTLLDSVWVHLMQNGNIIDSIQADINGFYYFYNIKNGIYYLKTTTRKPHGGVNSTDAVKVKRHFAGSELFTSSITLHAADVNLSMGINTTDAVKITRRFVGSDTSFTRGDWILKNLMVEIL